MVPRRRWPTFAEVEFGPTVATWTNVTRSVLRSIRKPLSSVLLSRQASATCDVDTACAERLLGASVVALAVAEYGESPPLLKARTR